MRNKSAQSVLDSQMMNASGRSFSHRYKYNPVIRPVRNINALRSGSKIKRTGGAVTFGMPNGLNPNGTCEREGISRPTQATRPRLRRRPVIHRKRAKGLSHACVITKDGYTDFGSAGVRLPNSVARANVRTSEAASFG